VERVQGIGGLFFRGADPAALLARYRDVLGVPLGEYGNWKPLPGTTVLATFDERSTYIGAQSQRIMVNFSVNDLDAMLAQVRAAGTPVDDHIETMDGVGRFGWIIDPAGNRTDFGKRRLRPRCSRP
jgi:predicted enzyme related to lactoylglutathione lyase